MTRPATRETEAKRVDGREVAGDRELAVEHDVAVEDRAGGVGDRLVVVVAVDEDGVETRDRPDGSGAGALEEAGEESEDRRRVAAGRGRLADGEADLALRHRDARDGIHHEDSVAARVAEGLGRCASR